MEKNRDDGSHLKVVYPPFYSKKEGVVKATRRGCIYLRPACVCHAVRLVGRRRGGKEGEGQRWREERRGKERGKEGEGLEIFRINSSSGLPRDRMKTKMYLREETLCVCISLSLYTHT